jgi:hypothetical protein
MVERLPLQTVRDTIGTEHQPLQRLTTQESSDPSIALLDAFAVVADVLTFYQERIANECYLRTATERRSVLELARAISYELNPGISAGTCVAFMAETAKGAPESVTVSRGTKVQSLPVPGKLPQTFETSDELVARPEWNALRPLLTKRQKITRDIATLVLNGVSTGLGPGDGVLLMGEEKPLEKLRDALGLKNPSATRTWAFETITHVTPDAKSGTTTIGFTKGDRAGTVLVNPKVYLFRTRANLFGHNAPDWSTMSKEVRSDYAAAHDLGTGHEDDKEWPDMPLEIELCNKETEPERRKEIELEKGIETELEKRNETELEKWIETELEKRNEIRLEKGIETELEKRNEIRLEKRNEIRLEKGKKTEEKEELQCPALYLDRVYPEILSNTLCVLKTPSLAGLYSVISVAVTSQTKFLLSAKTTRLAIRGSNISDFSDKIRKTVVFCQSERADDARVPDEADITAGTTTLTVQGRITGLTEGKLLILAGTTPADSKQVSETVTLAKSVPGTETTTLTFLKKLEHSYKRDSLFVYANAVPVTHGETVKEILGSGDAGRANQQFTLKKDHLTYVRATTVTGGKSSLSVRVDGLEWTEAPTLYGKGRLDEEYAVRISDDGKATVIFGDGDRGARLTSGFENVTAEYRTGTGPDGEVAAGSLTLLPVRPAGIREVTNPAAATGSAAPEGRDHARTNAPLRIRTLDRIVSLQDYEDFARAYTGIKKARAVGIWDGEEYCVHITIAGQDGKPVDEDTQKELAGTISLVHDPGHRVIFDEYNQVFFTIDAQVIFDTPRYQESVVRTAIRAALLDAFSFDKRSFGQDVTWAEITAAIQSVPGVIAVTDLYLTVIYHGEDTGGQPAGTGGYSTRIRADLAHYSAGTVTRTMILQIRPEGNSINGVLL